MFVHCALLFMNLSLKLPSLVTADTSCSLPLVVESYTWTCIISKHCTSSQAQSYCIVIHPSSIKFKQEFQAKCAKPQANNCCHAVAFRMYDLDNTGYIERNEVQRFLVALLKDNPAIDLDDTQLNAIIDQACV